MKKLTSPKTKQIPLVSIIMPVYNASKYLDEAILSVLNQTYKNWELITVDDGSKDNSLEILKRYAKENKKIKVFKNKKNLGVGKTTNYALSKAKGKFIGKFKDKLQKLKQQYDEKKQLKEAEKVETNDENDLEK